MLQAFVIVLREGFEAFLIVSVIASYLKRIGQSFLMPAVWWGILVAVITSAGMGFLLARGVNEPLWEGVLGVVAAVFVTTLVIHMWRHGAEEKRQMEKRLGDIAERPSKPKEFLGVFAFTVFMVAREGMETALMLIQVPQGHIMAGAAFGLLATAAYCCLWVKFSAHINVKLFFQVTGIFLLLFIAQILIYSVHEFAESGLIPNSEAFNNASEPFSPDGVYGRWFGVATVLICSAWLVFSWARSKIRDQRS
jgi:high-affinity iron transporter